MTQDLFQTPEHIEPLTGPLRRLQLGGRRDGIAGDGPAASPDDESPDAVRRRTYREFAPPDHLRAYVECFWHREAGVARSEAWVLPDGCVDFISINGLTSFVAGPATAPTRVEVAAGTEILGVRFRPGVAPGLLGVSARELLNQDVPLPDVWSPARAAPWEDAFNRPTLAAKVDGIVMAITARLATIEASDPFVRRAVAWIAGQPRGSVEELACLCGLSERQVRRRFHESVGYGPKTLQRILRLQRLLWLASTDEHGIPNLARLAVASGYADQSHMTREVVALAGATPRQLVLGSRPRSAVSELFKTTAGRALTLTLLE